MDLEFNALFRVLEANRTLTEEALGKAGVIRELLTLSSP